METVLRRLDAMDARLTQIDRIQAQVQQLTQNVERLVQMSSGSEANRRELGEIKKSLEAIRRRLEC